MSNQEISNKWSTYEAHIQSYRANMIASQSFLLAAGIFSVDKVVLSCTCAAIAIFQLWFIWFRVIRARTIIADFYKFSLGCRFDNCGCIVNKSTEQCENLLDEDMYLKNSALRKKVNKALAEYEGKPKLKYNMRRTRVKIDLILPISFTILWVILCLYSFNVIG